jgi:Domain of unknown function (DUF4328)
MPPVMPEGYKPLRGRAAWAQRALIATIVMDLIAVVSGFAEYRLYQQDVITPDELDSSDLRQALVALVQTAVFIFAVVMFIRWFKRAYENLRALGLTDLRFRVGWTIWGWFVPILNLWRPKQIANDIWRGSDTDAPPPATDEDWRSRPVPVVFQFWWAGFVILSFLYNTAFRLSVRADEIPEFEDAAVAYLFADSLSAITGVLAVLVVRRTTERQEARAAKATVGEGPDLERPSPVQT